MPRLRLVLEKAKGKMGDRSEVKMIILMMMMTKMMQRIYPIARMVRIRSIKI